MATIISIDTIVKKNAPFEEQYGVGSDAYMSLDEACGKKLNIIDIKEFENDKGKGVFALIGIGDEFRYICTHSVGLTETLTKPEIQENLALGNQIQATIVKRKSTKSDRMVYAFA